MKMPIAGKTGWALTLMLAVLCISVSGLPARAGTYDDFKSGTIQTSKWTLVTDTAHAFSVVTGGPGTISQPYVLEVSASGSDSYPRSTLRTTKPFGGKFIAGINFVNFSSDYTPTAGEPSSPSINLAIRGSDSDPFLHVGRSHSSSNQIIGFREYDRPNGTVKSAGGISFSGTSGALLVVYNGSQVSLGYSTSVDPAQWPATFTVVATFPIKFSTSPTLEILAVAGGGGTLGADIGGLYYSSKLPALLKGPSTTYDTFSSGAIGPNVWTPDAPNNFFSVVSGGSVGLSQAHVLHFSGAGSSEFPIDFLTATRPFGGNFFAGMDFYNFTSDFTPTSTDTANPAIQLRVVGGASDPVYLVARTHATGGHVIGWRKLDSSGNTLARGSFSYSGTSGAVLAAYVGNQLSLGYSTSTVPADWANSFRAVATSSITYTATPTLEIGGSGGGGGTVSADVGGLYFSAGIPALTVDITGTGTGNVSSLPAGINCGAALSGRQGFYAVCAADYKSGTRVALIPTPEAGSVFTGWSGDCKGSAACSVTMKTDKTVWANFDTGTCHYAPSSATKKISYKAATVTLAVKASVYNYCLAPDVSGIPAWVSSYQWSPSFTKNKGSLKITVLQNDDGADRTATITIGDSTFALTQTKKP